MLAGANTYTGGTTLNAGSIGIRGNLAQMARKPSRSYAKSTLASDKKEMADDSNADRGGAEQEKVTLGEAVFGSSEALRMRQEARQFFRALGPTKEWAENNYYQLPLSQQGADLITINAFWRDYAARDQNAPFVSSHIAEASRNFSEMMLALAVLDLPFESPKNATKTEGSRYTVTAAGPLVAFLKEIKEASSAKDHGELLVSENFYRQGDRYREEGNEKFDKYISDEFLAGVVYGANIVVTNPASSPRKLELLMQIPRGALPVLGSKATDSKALRLEACTTKTFEYFFYFPAPAEQAFPHYPVSVALNEENVGAAKQLSFKVVRELSRIDKTSWDYVSQYGSDEDVFAFLEHNNIERLNLERVAWRARGSGDLFPQAHWAAGKTASV